MIPLPQRGGCLCGEVRYALAEDPLTLYACHCTDCQRQTGASFALALVVRREAVRIERGSPRETAVALADGRVKRSSGCGRCGARLFSPSRAPGLALLEAGTLDDTSWLEPVAHIWTRSAQRWLALPEAALRFEARPTEEGVLAMVRAWKERRGRSTVTPGGGLAG
jgi:hypothetical protein